MPEMSHSRYDHRQIMLLAIFDGVFIADGSSRLNECRHAGSVSDLDTVIEWEESIAGEHRAPQVKIKLRRLRDCLTHGIYPACLTATFSDQLAVLDQRDRI